MKNRFRNKLARFAIMAFMPALILTSYGCQTASVKEKELKLFDDANRAFANDKFELAKKYYEKILNEYPDSPFSSKALMGQADSYYMNKEFFLSEPTYATFAEIYPVDRLTSRATFYRAMSYYRDIKDIRKDYTYTENAKSTFEQFSIKYPNHPAKKFSDEKIVELTNLLAQRDIRIIIFYFNIDAFNSCIGRVDNFLAKYPETKYIPIALLTKARSYMEEEAFFKAENLLELIAKNYQGTEHSASAKNYIKELQERKRAN